jgi:cellulose synthase/poly-beta-1,6-N-acetylglucosamine synthase-like glycosyltransferase
MPAYERLKAWFVPAAALVVAALISWVILTASRELARSFSILVYLLVNLIVFLDGLDLWLRLYFQRIQAAADDAVGGSPTSIALEPRHFSTYQRRLHLHPWALIVSIHNAAHELDDFMEAIGPLRDRTWVIDDGSDDHTCPRLRQEGWRCLEGGQNRKKPGALRFLLASLPPEIETVVVVDPDISLHHNALANLEEVISDFQHSGMAAVCPRIAVRGQDLLTRFQALEYCVSFSLGRKSLGDHSVNSGISIYRRSALSAALERHSLSVYAEDLENSVLMLASGEHIYYDSRMVVHTEGKSTWKGWFSQRVGWSYGLLRVYIGRFREIRRLSARGLSAQYQFFVYLGLFGVVFQPLKLLSFGLLAGSFVASLDSLFGLHWLPYWNATDPVYFLVAFTKYALFSLVALLIAVPREERISLLPIVPLYFLYALAQVLATTVGYANWCTLRLWGRRLVRDHYQDEETLMLQHERKSLASSMRALWSSSANE